MANWATLYEIATRQHGVVCVAAADQSGISRRTLRRRALHEQWHRPHAGVFVLPGAGWDFPQQAMAALCAAGPTAHLAGWSAAHLYGLIARPPRRVQLLMPYGRNAEPLGRVHVHRSRRLPPEHLTMRNGLRATTAARTLCDLAMWAGRRHLTELVAKAVGVELVTLDEIDEARRLLGPRRGSAGLAAVLLRLGRDGKTDSALERQWRGKLREHGFKPARGVYPVRHEGVLLGIVDIAFPKERVGIEVDGFVWHRTPGQLQRDHARQNAFLAAGWLLLRVGAAELQAPDAPLAQLREVLAERA